MDRLPDSVALAEFQENAPVHLRRITKSKRPALLTQRGRATAVVMSPETYDRLFEAAALSASIHRVRLSLKDFEQGKGRPAAEVIRELQTKYSKRAKRRRS